MRTPKNTVSCSTRTPYVEPTIRTIAGGLIISLSLLLYFSENFALFWLATLIFIGFNLFQSGLSGFCLLEKMLKYFRFTSELDEIRSLSRELKAVSDQQASYLESLNLLNEAVIELSLDGCIVSASDGWARLVDAPSIDKTLGESLVDFVADNNRAMLRRQLSTLERQENHPRRINFKLITVHGRTRWISANFMLVRQGERKIIKGVLSDISEGKRIEDERRNFELELTHARRLSSLGEMAAGLAHELNQPLAAVNLYIHGCLQRLESSPEQSEEIKQAMEAAMQQARRAGDIIQQIRGFVRKAPLRRKETDINGLIREALQLLTGDTAFHETEFTLNIDESLPPLALDRLQIQQVIINLISNAIESMEFREQGREVLIETHRNGDKVVLEVSDRGRGIPVEIAAQIFEPFVTGRENGLGLGLPISRSIIEEHGGKLWYSPRPGGGSRFGFTIPLSPPPEAGADIKPD